MLILHTITTHFSKNSMYLSKEDGIANANLAEIFTYLPAAKIVSGSILQQILSSKGDLLMGMF